MDGSAISHDTEHGASDANDRLTITSLMGGSGGGMFMCDWVQVAVAIEGYPSVPTVRRVQALTTIVVRISQSLHASSRSPSSSPVSSSSTPDSSSPSITTSST
ncbi:hypothetical protein AcW2_006179 [Taiwanofungus camphoratus]|nr:hypothetical protein AcW2_006179 [Antrodia cinnamomea]